jgi:hypothetical protein
VPKELYADYQKELFESQARILDVPSSIQQSSSALLKFLGVHLAPEPTLIVRHLLYLASLGIPANLQIYRALNDKADDQSLLLLRGKACLWLGDAYREPSKVFWSEHAFGRYRWRLGEQLRSYGKLLSTLRVRETPTYKDVLSVMKEIASEFGPANKPLDDEVHSVLMECWRAIARCLQEGTIDQQDIQRLGELKCATNKERNIWYPKHLFFENRAGLAEKFGGFLARNVISRPLDAGDALALAGVRSLGTAVAIELLECRSPVADPTVSEHIRSRRNELARVLDALDAGYGTGRVLDRLEQIQCHVSDSIEIRYRLQAFGQDRFSAAEQVPALYQAATGVLLYARRDHSIPWASIARELAIALYPEDDPGRFAAGLKEALAPATSQEAAAVLDELGFARLDMNVTLPGSNRGAATGLGTDAPVWSSHEQTAPSDQQSADGMSIDDARRRLLGQNSPEPTPPTHPPGGSDPHGSRGYSGGGDGPGRGSQQGPSHHVQARRTSASTGGRPFISYVATHPTEAEPDPDGLDALKRQVLEERAIQFILAREPQLHRTPRHNPGYDLFEPDENGQVTRWVEVKAMTGELLDRPVGLSHTQFECARDHGESYWLYVVEQAGGSEWRIIRIQDPAGKSRTFTFDHGWLTVAEIDSRDNEEEKEQGEDRNQQD